MAVLGVFGLQFQTHKPQTENLQQLVVYVVVYIRYKSTGFPPIISCATLVSCKNKAKKTL